MNPLVIAALGVGGLYLWSKRSEPKARGAIVPTEPTMTPSGPSAPVPTPGCPGPPMASPRIRFCEFPLATAMHHVSVEGDTAASISEKQTGSPLRAVELVTENPSVMFSPVAPIPTGTVLSIPRTWYPFYVMDWTDNTAILKPLAESKYGARPPYLTYAMAEAANCAGVAL